MPAIETERLTKFYGPHRGVQDVTIAVEQGEVFGFLGPNGAGKTTTIRTLLDLLHPTSGSARIFGLDSRRESVAIRKRLGNLPGDFGYGKLATGREALTLLARLRGVAGLGRAQALAERFRADLERPLGQLSRGNRQKIGLILAVFHEPELLVLDEPTSGLDPLMQEEFLALVREERERGCAVFLSSHELDEVQRVCDRVGIIREGRVVAVERVGELSSVEQYLHAEMLSLIVPLAVGYLAVRSLASALSGAAESGRLDVLLSAPVSRRSIVTAGFLATALEVAAVLLIALALTLLGSLLAGAQLSFSSALAGFAGVWPLALLSAGLGIVVTGFSLRTSVVTGSVAGVLVGMYVLDLIGRLDPSLDGVRYASVFRYYGKPIEDGLDPLSFLGVTVVAALLAAAGAALFERRDLMPG